MESQFRLGNGLRMLRNTITVALLISPLPTSGGDHIRDLQRLAVENGQSPVAHWGWQPDNYTLWGTHTNRLVPVYTFGTKGAGAGIDLSDYSGDQSLFRSQSKVIRLYGRVPHNTVNAQAEYLDQTNIFELQNAALDAGKKHIVLIVFDGMDWETTRAASIHNLGKVTYETGRGTGTHFQDYDASGTSQFGYAVTSPHNDGTTADVNTQTVTNPRGVLAGGYDAARGGPNPWTPGSDSEYLVSQPKQSPGRHAYTDSASAAVSMVAGIKTYNNAINVDVAGQKLTTIAHLAQDRGYSVGIVSSVPFSHATPATAYAHNVHRNDLQDLTRDLLGLKSISHPHEPLPGLDVVIGGGHGVESNVDKAQGENFEPGTAYIADSDLQRVDVANGGQYVVAQRTAGVSGAARLREAALQAASSSKRLLGFYGLGTAKGHLPYQTADGDFNPTVGRQKTAETYTAADLEENPTLADMTRAALTVVENDKEGFWLMIEAGDVDWANHDNNLDNSIGAVNSGDAAVKVITDWVEKNSSWQESVLIVTADHGHFLVIDQPDRLAE